MKEYRYINNYEITPDEIAKTLVKLADFGNDIESENQAATDLENALYYLDAIAQNEYNNDYFRTFYNVLAKITDKYN